MGLIVVAIKYFSFVLQQSILIGWDRIVSFNKLLHVINYFLIVWLMGMEICLTGCVMIISFANKCLMVDVFFLGFVL